MADQELSHEDQAWLLGVARAALIRCTGGPERDVGPMPSLQVQRLCGAFVSLHRSGRLRGCIGTFRQDQPLHRVVREMAVAAALQDDRFRPVQASELGQIEIEISALTPMEDVLDPATIEVGRDGLFITGRGRSGVLLPQVATEYGMNREEFLDATCEKAGLPLGFWKQGARIQRFTAQVFSESSVRGVP